MQPETKVIMEHQQFNTTKTNRSDYGASLAWESSQTEQQATQNILMQLFFCQKKKPSSHPCPEGIKVVEETEG